MSHSIETGRFSKDNVINTAKKAGRVAIASALPVLSALPLHSAYGIDSGQVEAANLPPQVPFEHILIGTTTSDEFAKHGVVQIDNQAQLNKVWTELNPKNPKAPTLDFKDQSVLIASAGRGETNGRGIFIRSAANIQGQARIDIQEFNPGPECNTGTVKSPDSPFDMVAIKNPDGKKTFNITYSPLVTDKLYKPVEEPVLDSENKSLINGAEEFTFVKDCTDKNPLSIETNMTNGLVYSAGGDIIHIEGTAKDIDDVPVVELSVDGDPVKWDSCVEEPQVEKCVKNINAGDLKPGPHKIDVEGWTKTVHGGMALTSLYKTEAVSKIVVENSLVDTNLP